MIKNNDPLFRRELLQIGRFDRAADIDAHWLIMIKETGQMQTGTADIVDRYADLVKIRRAVEKIKVELRNKLGQQNGIGICHALTSFQVVE